MSNSFTSNTNRFKNHFSFLIFLYASKENSNFYRKLKTFLYAALVIKLFSLPKQITTCNSVIASFRIVVKVKLHKLSCV